MLGSILNPVGILQHEFVVATIDELAYFCNTAQKVRYTYKKTDNGTTWAWDVRDMEKEAGVIGGGKEVTSNGFCLL